MTYHIVVVLHMYCAADVLAHTVTMLCVVPASFASVHILVHASQWQLLYALWCQMAASLVGPCTGKPCPDAVLHIMLYVNGSP